MWDDPLFNPEAKSDQEYLNDPEFIDLRRGTRLTALDILYLEIDIQRQRSKRWKEQAGWYAWCLNHTLDQIKQHIPIRDAEQWRELLEQMNVDATAERTLGLDFAAWLDNYNAEQERRRKEQKSAS